MSALAHKVEWLVALEEIRRVIALYAKAGDAGNDAPAMAALFTADAHWSCAGFGDFHGREQIVEELARIGRERVLWSLHYPVAPLIDLDEACRAAHAHWWLWELATLREHDSRAVPHWLAATYDADFERAADGWRIARLRLDIQQTLPHAPFAGSPS